jgi:hypothetical protein
MSRAPRSSRRRLPAKVLALCFGLGLVAPAACEAGGLVGGNCRPEVMCGGVCVDLTLDQSNCGVCGNECEFGIECIDGICGGPHAGGSSSGGSSSRGGSSNGGGAAEGPGGSDAGGSSMGGTLNVNGGNSNVGGSNMNNAGAGGLPPCIPPYDEPWKCGDCETQCPPEEPLCAPIEGAGGSGGGPEYECVPACDPPLVQCDDQCVDTETNPLHCGRCNHVCPSGICEDSKCVGVVPGHLVSICMSYEQIYAESAQTTLLGNAVFARESDPVKILAYGKYTPNIVKTQVNRAIGWASGGRAYEITQTTNSNGVPGMLDIADFDVFLVYDQSNAPTGELADLGTDWHDAIQQFAEDGGVVVATTGGQDGVSEMRDFLTNAEMLETTDTPDFTYQLGYNQAPGYSIGLGVVSPFVTLYQTCTFATGETPSGSTVFVVTNTDPDVAVGEPIVVDKIITP